MEHLSPTLSCLYELKRSLAQSKPLREGLSDFISRHPGPLASTLRIWLSYFEANRLHELPSLDWTSDYQPVLIVALEAGLCGQPIQDQLNQLIEEVELASQLEIENYLTRLPFKALVPVFLFQFPAFILLIFGPVFSQLISGVSNA